MVNDTFAKKNCHFYSGIIWFLLLTINGVTGTTYFPIWLHLQHTKHWIGSNRTGSGYHESSADNIFTLLHWFSMSLLLTRPTKVCLSLESTTVSGPPLSPCTTIKNQVPNLCYRTSQVAECSLSAHREKSSRVSSEIVDWHLPASTMDTSKKKPIKQ